MKPSGAEVMLRLAAETWQNAGFKLFALSIGDQRGAYAEELESAGYKVIHLPLQGTLFQWAIMFLQLLKHHDINIVHVHAERLSAITTTLPIMVGCRTFRTVHNNFPYTGLVAFQKRLERGLTRLTQCVQIAISPSVQQNEKSSVGNSTKLCWNWFDNSHYRPPTPEERSEARAKLGLTERQFVLLSVGNGNDVKNYSSIIEALAILRRPPEDLIYLMVGNEHPRHLEQHTATRCGIERNVIFCGSQTDVGRYFWASDAFVVPSLYEGFSISALEGLATGIACIFSNAPGLWDLKRFNLSIDWIEPKAHSIARLLETLLANENRIIRNSNTAEIVRSEFGVKKRAIVYQQLWEQR